MTESFTVRSSMARMLKSYARLYYDKVFKGQLALYINKDGHFCVNSAEHITEFPADNHVNDLRAVIKKAHPTDFPSIGLEDVVSW